MSAGRLLAVVEGTPEGLAAVRYAARRAAGQARVLVLVTVVAPPSFVQWGAVQEALAAEAQAEAEARLEEAIAQLGDGAPPVETRLLSGDPVAALVELARQIEGLEALVLAIGGEPGPLAAELVVARGAELPCPLVLVPPSVTG